MHTLSLATFKNFYIFIFYTILIWCIWRWISLSLPCLVFTELPETISYFLSSHKGMYWQLFIQKNNLALHSFFSPCRTLMAQMLGVFVIVVVVVSPTIHPLRSLKLCLFFLQSFFFSIRFDYFYWPILIFTDSLVFHFRSAIELNQ